MIQKQADVYAQVEVWKNAFKGIDTDGDGSLSLEEAKAAGISEELFKKIDVDKNGKLSVEEFVESMEFSKSLDSELVKTRALFFLRAADTDGDGRISRAESLQAGICAAVFDALPHDADGQVTQEILTDYLKTHTMEQAA